MELRGKRVVVVGLGASGAAACRFCRERGATVVGVDDKAVDAFPADLAESLREAGVSLVLGGQDLTTLLSADLIVISPGVPPSEPIAAAEAAGIPIVAEVELASWFVEAPIVGITGTNGKSTVTALIGAMLEHSGRATFIGGNLGTPMIEAVATPAARAGGAMVIELSSFQLERIERMKPRVAVLLNVTEDHLDRYPSMAEYTAAKAKLFAALDASDAVVVNREDPVCVALAADQPAPVHYFSREGGEVHLLQGAIVDEVTGQKYGLDDFKLSGAHNRSNACAAVLAARLMGVEPSAIREALSSFTGLAHRMEYVAERAGVTYYNDSKATNVGAAVAAVEGLEQRALLIVGGRDKGGDYEPLRRQVEEKVRAVVIIGEAADRIEAALDGAAPLYRAESMEDAVRRASELAQPGDAVVLAPACSSFDMFKNYAARGEAFREAVVNFLP